MQDTNHREHACCCPVGICNRLIGESHQAEESSLPIMLSPMQKLMDVPVSLSEAPVCISHHAVSFGK